MNIDIKLLIYMDAKSINVNNSNIESVIKQKIFE